MKHQKLVLALGILALVAGIRSSLADEEMAPARGPDRNASYALGFKRSMRFSGELHRTLGSPIAQKRQGTGLGFGAFFPLPESNFDLGVRYIYIREEKDRVPDGGKTAHTLLNFVFDFFVWPTKIGGLFVGGELGIMDPDAREFFSVYSSYSFVAKVGYEYTIPDSKWSATFEARRSLRDDYPLQMARETKFYSNSIAFGARYRL